MIRDLLNGPPRTGSPADVCVVGAGAAGIVLAVDLVRRGKTVTLLEAGGAHIEEDSQDPYRSEVVGLPYTGIHTGRFRVNGGTTTHWSGQVLEFDTADFELRDWVPDSGWPIRGEELAPYYERALELEGLSRVLRTDNEVWKALGITEETFVGLDPYFSRWCPETNLAVLHHETLERSSQLELWLHANAVELLLEGEQAKGVRVRTLNGQEAIFQATQYVFCLGAIESARFFLQPRQGSLPWNTSGLLGRHYQDHIDSTGATIVPKNAKRFHDRFDNVFLDGYKYHPKLRLSKDRQRDLQTLDVGASIIYLSDADETLTAMRATAKKALRGRFNEIPAKDLGEMAANLPLLLRQAYRFAVQHRDFHPAAGQIRLRVHCEQEPTSESSVTLAETRDALGMLRTRLDWRISDREMATMKTYVEVAKQALAGIADVVPDPALMAGDREYLSRVDDSCHHMGGMKMAVSDREGVVDPNLRLHGTKNAYVCSCAAFPSSSFWNPTHTLLTLAVRLAAHLSQFVG